MNHEPAAGGFRKLQITQFTEVNEPITEPITKFGGQPVWLEEPRWPLCPSNGKPIPFLGQIKLEPEIFGDFEAKMAYIFLGGEGAGIDDNSWPTDHGDSAVVLQPGNLVFTGLYPQDSLGFAEYSVAARGPTTVTTISIPQAPYLDTVEKECSVQMQAGVDRSFVSFEAQRSWTEEAQDAYTDALAGHKIGGTPSLWDGEIPDQETHILLLQMESTDSTDTPLPFGVYYGDGGCSYWFIARDGQRVSYVSRSG